LSASPDAGGASIIFVLKGAMPMCEILNALGSIACIGCFVLAVYQEYKRKEDAEENKKR
jgi:hypothetical protein